MVLVLCISGDCEEIKSSKQSLIVGEKYKAVFNLPHGLLSFRTKWEIYSNYLASGFLALKGSK